MGEVRQDALKVVMGICGDKEIANKEDQIDNTYKYSYVVDLLAVSHPLKRLATVGIFLLSLAPLCWLQNSSRYRALNC